MLLCRLGRFAPVILDLARQEADEVLAACLTSSSPRAQRQLDIPGQTRAIVIRLPNGQLDAVAARAASVQNIRQIPDRFCPALLAIFAAEPVDSEELLSRFPNRLRACGLNISRFTSGAAEGMHSVPTAISVSGAGRGTKVVFEVSGECPLQPIAHNGTSGPTQSFYFRYRK